MEGASNSWVRRTKFSHTVCHRLDSSRIPAIPPFLHSLRSGDADRRRNPDPTSDAARSDGVVAEGCKSSNTRSGSVCVDRRGRDLSSRLPGYACRAPSPPPVSTVSSTFMEARSEVKRFTSPAPRRGSDVCWRGESVEALDRARSKGESETAIGRKEAAWLRYFVPVGGKVNADPMSEDRGVVLSQLYFGVRFATGAHSKLYRGLYMEEDVAIKVITQPHGDDEVAAQLEKQFKREVALLSRLSHRNVLKLIASCSDPPVFIIITKYLSGGCLRSFLHKLEKKALPLKETLSIALDIARGMEYIHSQGVFHCDLKPDNILFDQDLCVKIADFGIACEEARSDVMAGDPGTYRWMAPEMIKNKKYGRKVDVYSFGLILWEMVTGKIPYEHMTPIQVAFAVVDKDLRPTIPSECPLPLRALIEHCWVLNPDKRPEFCQIVKVLEQFASAFSRDGTLDQVQKLSLLENNSWFRQWMQKIKATHDGPVLHAPKLL